MLKIIKVAGNSLSPFFLPGDYVLIGKNIWSAKGYVPGDFIVFNHPVNGLMIKKVLSIDPAANTFEVAGTHPLSVDSSSLGRIQRRDILGKVLWHIKKPRTNINN